MHQKGRFFASETLNYAFFSQKTGCFCTEMIHSAFRCTLLGHGYEPGGRPTPLCGPAAVLVAVHVKIEVFLRHFVVGAVFTHLAQRFIKRGFQLGVVLTQADTGAVAKVLFVFNDGPAKAKSFPAGCFRKPSLAATSSCSAASRRPAARSE